MALPTDPGDTFLREVDENLRRDQMRDAARRYGRWIIAGVVLFLAAVGGWMYWQERKAQKAATQSEEMAQIYADIGAGKTATVQQRLSALAEDGGPVVRASALFAGAAVALDANDRAAAISKYREAAGDESLPEAYRSIARIRVTSLEFDTMKPQDVIAQMEPLTKPGTPFYGSAGELTAMALLKQGKKTEAGRLFAAIAADKQVPETIRARAVQIAGTLGIDATSSYTQLAL